MLCTPGQARQVIPRVAEQFGADLVAVGTTGHADLLYLLLGSVSQHVLHTLSCDVLLARLAAFRFELP
jgi:nucleotide-binding universal stress UspA family protein